MNRFLSCGIILVGLLISVGIPAFGEEKTSLYPRATWVVSDSLTLSYLNAFANKDGEEPVGFPDEIDLDAGVNGITVTDGNDQWTILSLGVRLFDFSLSGFTEKKLEDEAFHERLLKTTFISMFYQNDKTKMILRKGRLFLLSNNFPVDRLDDLAPEQKWFSLQEKYHFAFLSESPEWMLYPELPPEKENEGTFLKKLRTERSKEDYSKDDTIESTLFAMNWNEQGDFKGTLTTKLKDGTKKSKQILERQKKNAPFGLAGFFRENLLSGASGSLFYRWYPEDNAFGEAKLLLKGGISPLGPEDQKEGEPKKTSSFKFSFAVWTKSVETLRKKCLEEGYDMIDESNLLFATPIYSDDIKDDEDYLKSKSENESFRKCLDAIHDLIRTVRIGSEGWEKGKPVDFGLLVDADTLTLAASTPPGGAIPDSVSILPVITQVNDFLKKLYVTVKEKYDDFPLLSLHLVHGEMEIIDETKFSVGQIILKSDAGEIPLLAFLSATKNDLYALQITTKGLSNLSNLPTELFELSGLMDMNELKEQNYALFKRRVEESISGKRENCPTPESFVQLDANGLYARLGEHFSEREYSYSLILRKDSLGLLSLLSGFLGPNTIKRFMPF